MKKALIATTLIASLAFTQNANAGNESEAYEPEDKTKTEVIGFGSGILAGAALAGPIGAFVGGVMGILIADEVNDEQTKAAQMEALKDADIDIQQQTQQLVALQTDLQNMKNDQMMQAVNFNESQQQLLQDKVGRFHTNIQFQTASVAIEDVYQSQLSGIADILQQFPELVVRIEGYADQRGDTEFNQALSTARAEAVANYLRDLNVDTSQLNYAGNGEAKHRDLSQQSKESLFFDRRVSVQILPKGQIMTAAK